MTANPLIILDRDGVINHDSDEYIKMPDEWLPIDGSAEAIARLNKAGYRIGVASNQSGIGRGMFNLDTLSEIHQKMYDYLARHNARIDQLEFCTDHPNNAGPFRKPAPGMVLKLLKDFNAKAEETWFVGDTLSDINCALNAGCKPVLVLTGKGKRTLEQSDFSSKDIPVFRDLYAFVESLLG